LFAEATKYHKTASVQFLVQPCQSVISSVKILGEKNKRSLAFIQHLVQWGPNPQTGYQDTMIM